MLQTAFRRITNHVLPTVCKNLQKFSSTKQNTSIDQQTTSGALSSYWVDSAPTKPKTSQLNADISVDTCVIGSGIAGLTTAYLLAKQGQKVAVLEDGEVCSGETSRTTGYLTWVIDDGIQNIAKIFGRDGATVHVDSHRAAVDLVEQISKDEGIECEFKRLSTYWISRKPKSEQSGQPDKDIEAEYKAMKDIGMNEVSIVDRPPYAVDDGKCLKIERQGQFHSVAYCYGLADSIQANGGTIYTRSRVVDWKSGKEPQAKTENGHTVKCKNLVHATNVPLQYLTIIGQLEAFRTYIVGGKVPKGKYEWCVFQDDSMTTHKPYNYGRFTRYNDEFDLLLVGGKDHLVGFDNDYERRYQELEKWTKERYPDIQFNYRWSGQVEEPADLIAFIGKNPGNDNVYVMTGDSGLGLTHGTLGGKLISDLILGIPNPWAELYDPKRVSPSVMPEVVKHMIEVNAQFKDYFTGRDVADIDAIPKGEGAVVCKGIHRYAVYKDENGKAHACSAVCPHLKGLVRWNNSEKSWDCPIHGSRFDKFGELLHGPSAQSLGKVDVDKVLKVINKK